MMVGKSHDQSFAGWRLIEVGGVVSVQTRGPKNQGSQQYLFQSQSQGQEARSANVQGQEMAGVQSERKVSSLCLHTFVPSGPSVDWVVLTHFGEDNLLYSDSLLRC